MVWTSLATLYNSIRRVLPDTERFETFLKSAPTGKAQDHQAILTESLIQAEQSGNSLQMARQELLMADWLFHKRADYAQSCTVAQQVYQRSQTLSDGTIRFRALDRMFSAQIIRGDFAAIQPFVVEYHHLGQTLPAYRSLFHINMGALYLFAEQWNDALNEYHQVLEMLTGQHSESRANRAIISTLEMICTAYQSSGSYEEAQNCAHEAIAHARYAGISRQRSSHLLLARCAYLQGSLQQARLVGEEAQSLAASEPDADWKAFWHQSMAEITFALNDRSAAHDHLHQAQKYYLTVQTPFTTASLHHLLSNFYQQNGEFEQALNHFRLFHEEERQLTDRRAAAQATAQQINKPLEQAPYVNPSWKHVFLSGMPDLLFRLDANGIFLDYHAPADHPLYAPPEARVGKHISSAFTPELSTEILESIEKARVTQHMLRIECAMLINGSKAHFEARITPIDHSEALVIVRNITEHNKLSRIFARQTQFLELLLKLSSTFINMPPEKLDDVLGEMLKEAGTFLEMDRIYIFDYDFKRGVTSNTHEWCAEGIEPQISELQNIPLQALHEDWVAPHLRGEDLYIPDVNARPADDPIRLILEPQGIKSLLTIPLMNDRECLGFIGLDAVRQHHIFNEIEQQLLRVFSQMLVNVRKRLNSLREVQANQRFLTDMIENNGSMVYFKNLNGVYERINHTWEEISGMHRDQVIGKTDAMLFPTAIAEQFRANDLRVIAANKLIELEEVMLIDGEERYFISNKFPMRDAQGRIIGLCGVSTEITQRKNVEMELRNSELQMRAIMNTALDAIIVTDTKGNVLDFNPAAERMFGYTARNIIGKRLIELIIPPSKRTFAVENFRQYLANGDGPSLNKRVETTVMRSDKHEFPVEFAVSEIRLGDETLYSVYIRDITDRKQADIDLRKSEQRYRQMFRMHGLPKLIIDPRNGAIIDANPAASQFYGFDQPTLRTMNIMDINLSPVQEVQEKMKRAEQTSVLNCVFVHQGAGNRPRDVEVFTGPVEIDGQQFLYSIVTDITEKLQAKAQLQEAIDQLEERVQERTAQLEEERNLLRTVIDTLPDFIYVKDREQRLLLNNIAHAQFLGSQNGQDLVGKRAEDLFPAVMAAEFKSVDDQVLQEQQPVTNLEEHPVGYNGREIWALTTKVPLRSVHGDVIGLVGITRDITERKRAEAELLALSHRLQLATETGEIGIWDWDLRSDELILDNQMFKLYNLSRDQFSGKGTEVWSSGIYHPDDRDRVQAEMMAAVQGLKSLDTEFRIRHSDENIHHLKVKAVVFRDDAGMPIRVLGVNWDITLQKQAQEKLQLALEKEKELGELKSRFVTMTSHEFRTPLTAIQATVETLTLYRERMNEAQVDERLDRIRQQINHMRDIMEDVLRLARMQAGRVKFDPTPADVRDLCSVIIEEFQSLMEFRGRILFTSHDEAVMASFDRRLLRNVISNLAQNALKYSPLNKKVSIDLKQDDQHFILRFRDEGIGIPAADMEHLFEPFHRASNVGTISGTGLGLSITKQAVELHGGTILVESEIGAGTTFIVQIPKHTTDTTGIILHNSLSHP